ncbi:MAG: NYN domain-containing protein [Deltaproteobacteria bacterium]|nr:NYN domain-containing protein [Deltaproteobacteria bacterium]
MGQEHLRRVERMALLVDGENIAAHVIGAVIANVSTYGRVPVRRIYGDWTSGHMHLWKEPAQKYGFRAVHYPAPRKGKNTADIALTTDAMDILHRSMADAFAIVSGDADYGPLVVRLREYSHFVLGFGQRHTSPMLINAYDHFLYLEDLVAPSDAEIFGYGDLDTLIENAFGVVGKRKKVDENTGEWVWSSNLTSVLKRLSPYLNPHSLGYKNFVDLYKHKVNLVEVEYHDFAGSKHPFVRMLRKNAPLEKDPLADQDPEPRLV